MIFVSNAPKKYGFHTVTHGHFFVFFLNQSSIHVTGTGYYIIRLVFLKHNAVLLPSSAVLFQNLYRYVAEPVPVSVPSSVDRNVGMYFFWKIKLPPMTSPSLRWNTFFFKKPLKCPQMYCLLIVFCVTCFLIFICCLGHWRKRYSSVYANCDVLFSFHCFSTKKNSQAVS
jgi:hypothetical protein